MFKFYSLKERKFQSQLKTLFFIIGILIIESCPAFSIDITHYISNFSEITGMFDSQEHGLVYSNSLGVFKLNKITGEVTKIEYQGGFNYTNIDNFFEFNGELYFYHKRRPLFKLNNNTAETVLNTVNSHYVKDEKLYIISEDEPCIKVLTKSGKNEYNIGDGNSDIPMSNFIEINGEVYGFLFMNWSGTTLIFKFTENDVTPIMSSAHKQYNEFKEFHASEIFNINDELWFTTFDGIFKFSGDTFQKIDTSFPFRDEYIYSLYYENGVFYYSYKKGMCKFDLETKEEIIVYPFENTPPGHSIVKGKNSLYYIFSEKIFKFNLIENTYTDIFNIKPGKILVFTEGLDEKIFVAKQNQIEWYNNFQPKIFGENGVFTNKFYGILYDEKRNLIAALGRSSDDFLIQTFDGEKWDTIHVPFSTGTSYPKTNIVSDKEGNYFVTIEDFLGFYDGDKWERISLLKNPDITDIEQREFYNVLFRDSAGGVWFGVYLDEYDENTKKNISGNSIWRYFDGSFSNISKISEAENDNSIKNGVCLKDGTCIIDISNRYLFKFFNNEYSYITVSDGVDYPETNNDRNLCVNKNNQIVLTFTDIEGWSNKYGHYNLKKGISTYNNENWEHYYYKNIATATEFDINYSYVTSDTYGNEWLLGYKHFVRINSNGSFNSFPIDIHSFGFQPGMFKILQNGNVIWHTTKDNGIFKITLPEPTGVNENSESSKDNFLVNEVVENNLLELSAQPDIYSIISVLGEKITEGKNKKFIDISSLSSGIYFIISDISGKKQINKFIKLN